MFGSVGLPELALIGFFGLLLFGPDRMPKLMKDAAHWINRFKSMSDSAMNDLKSEMGPEFQNLNLRSLHPQAMLRELLAEHPELADEAKEQAEAVQDKVAATTKARTTRSTTSRAAAAKTTAAKPRTRTAATAAATSATKTPARAKPATARKPATAATKPRSRTAA